MFKKKAAKNVVNDDVNNNILNIITPAGISYGETEANLSENKGKIFTISKYPSEAPYGWLSPLCNLEGTITNIEYRYTDPERLIQVYNDQFKNLEGAYETLKEESDKMNNLVARDNIKNLINRIAVEKEPVGYMSILIFPQATNWEKLDARIKSVSTVISMSGCNIRVLKNKQHRALNVIAPYGLLDDAVSNMGQRNIPISTLLGGFPMANAGINDPEGIYLGKIKGNSGRVVILDQWLRNKDRVNSNWFITGIPGIGKSTILKDMTIKFYALGTKFIFFDPEEEYKELAKNPLINGEIIDCAGGTSGRINPLQIRPVPRITKEDLDAEESLDDYYVFDTENGTSDMALYIQQLRTFFKLKFGKDEFREVSVVLEECLIELYNRCDITWETEISNLNNEDFPIMEDLYYLVRSKIDEKTDLTVNINFNYTIDTEKLDSLNEKERKKYLEELKKTKNTLNEELRVDDKPKATEYKRMLYEKLSLLLYPLAIGADKMIWNGYTTLNSKTDFIVLDVSKLLDLDEDVRRAQFFNLQMWGWQQMSKDRQEKVVFGVDEGYLFVDPDYPELMKYMRNISKRDRKYEGGLWFITHSVVDVLDPTVKRYGQAIIDNACYKFIMGTDGKNLEETKKLFNLTEREEAILSAKNRGEGVLMAGSTRVNLVVDIMDEFLEMIGKAGGR